MTNVGSNRDQPSAKYPIFIHPTAMNSYPTTSPSVFHDERHPRTTSSFANTEKLIRDDKFGVPLRQRHLPASFWKEPNVPRHPFLPPWFGQVPYNWQQQGQDYKDFLDRLQTIQMQGLTNVGSRFPITEFLYYNYGMKDRSDGTVSKFQDNLWPLGLPQHKKQLTPSVSTTQQLCPYFGCNCTISSPDVTSKIHDDHGVTPALDLLQASVWKPTPTKSVSSFPTRFHPFAHAR